MVHNNQTATGQDANQRNRSGTLLIGVGILWLLLSVGLLFYQLTDSANVELSWETATEQQTVGFNVYRSYDPDENFVLVNEEQLIDSKGGPVSGATYSFIDSDVEAGRTYYYILEEVELDGSQNQYADEVFEYSVPEYTWWVLGLAALCLVIGLVILVSGLKEKKKQ